MKPLRAALLLSLPGAFWGGGAVAGLEESGVRLPGDLPVAQGDPREEFSRRFEAAQGDV